MIRFTILQIDHKLDNRNYLFMTQEFLLAHGDPFPPPRKIYEEVYSECQPKFDPEAAFTRFNINHPEDYRGRSLSISDIVCYHLPGGDVLDLYCDHVGYVGVDLQQGYEVAKEPEYIPASDRTSEVASLFYNKSGKMKTVSVNISHLFSKRCTCIDEDVEVILDAACKPIYKESSQFDYGCLLLAGKKGGATLYSITEPLTAGAADDIRNSFNTELFDVSKFYLTKWNEEKKDVVALFGEVPHTYDEMVAEHSKDES